MRVGWTPYWLASSLTVRSPLRAAKATWALNAAVCCVRLPAIGSPFLGHQSSLAGGPVFGVHYNLILVVRLERLVKGGSNFSNHVLRHVLSPERISRPS